MKNEGYRLQAQMNAHKTEKEKNMEKAERHAVERDFIIKKLAA